MSNVVPDGWNNKIFADAITLSYGKSPKEIFAEDGTYPVVGTGGITGYTNHYLHEGYTTVVGRKGSINNPSFFSDKFWAIDTTYYASNYKDTDAKWFFYLLQSIDLTKYNEASGVPSLNRDTLYSISFIAPPLPEQQKIAAILTSVDEVIEKTQAQINKLKDLKTGMMQELLTRGVGVDGKPHTEFKDSPKWTTGKISEITKIPLSWELVNINDVARLESGHTPSRDNVEYWGGEYQWLSLHDTKELNTPIIKKTKLSITQAGLDNSSARLLPIGTVAFSRTASVGHCVMFGKSMATSQDFANYVCGEKLSPRYLLQLFRWMQHVWNRLSEGSTHKTIYMPTFKKLQILLPPIKEQFKIADIIESIDNDINKSIGKLYQYKNLKKALMHDLLTGKVRVNVD
jgi:type I restriction enzyme S subunit